SLQVSRGCPFNCSFCSVSNFFGRTYRHRPIADVIREIEHLEGKFVAFIDDNIVGNPKYSKELFKALIPYKIRWVGQSSFNIIRDPDLLKAARKSGCAGLFIGLETISEESMQEIGKVQNDIKEFKVGIKRLHDHGIIVLGAFIFGFDSDDKDVFKRTLDFALESKLDLAQFSILTPLPGTRLYEKLSSEDRIINTDWSKYDMGNAVFMPAQMTPEELQKGMGWAWREFYSYGSILKRLFSVNSNLLRHLLYFAPLLVLNMSFKRALDFESKMAKASITKH
ncbi:MAG: radical SAM protein, partial [Acetomicrobium sp.]